MNTLNCVCDRTTNNELEHVVEPLASYICASDKPSTALHFVLAALRRQVDATNELASTHYRTFRRSH